MSYNFKKIADELRESPPTELFDKNPPEHNDVPVPDIKPPTPRQLEADNLGVSVAAAARANADEAAKRADLGRKLDIAPEIVDVDTAEEDLFTRDNDPEDLMREHPAVARYLAREGNAEIVGRDVDNLKGIEKVARRWVADPIVSAGKALVATEQAIIGLDRAMRGMSREAMPPQIRAAIETLGVLTGYTAQTEKAAKAIEDTGLLDTKAAQDFLSTLYSPEQQKVNAELEEIKGFFPTLGGALERPSIIAHTVIQSLGPMFAGAAVGRQLVKEAPKVSARVGAAVGEGLMIFGGTAKRIEEEQERALEGRQALLAGAAGVAGGGISILGGKIAQKIGITDIDTALVEGTLRRKLTKSGMPQNVAARVLAGGVQEGVLEEMPQEAIEQIAENVALGKQWDEGVPEGMAMGALTGAALGSGAQVFSGPPKPEGLNKDLSESVRKTMEDNLKAAAASQNRDIVENISKMASEDKTKARSQEAFHDFVQTMADEEGALQEVYVNAKTLNDALSQSGITKEEIQQKMPEVAKDIEAGLDAGTDVRVPIADYATYIAGTPAETTLLDNLRTTPEGMTYAEAQEFYQGQASELEQQAKDILEKNEPVLSREEFEAQKPEGTYEDYLKQHNNQKEVFAQDTKTVHDNILGRLNKVGRFTKDVNQIYALPFREFYATNAARLGIMPSELYKRIPLNFNNLTLDTGGQLSQFAGKKAATANLGNLSRAQQMEEQGAGKDEIRLETGWRKDVDGEWKFEIDDSKANLKIGRKENPVGDHARQLAIDLNRTLELGDVLEHDRLFEAYPGLQNVGITFLPGSKMGGANAQFHTDSNLIYVNESLPKRDALSSVLHEVQHAIQREEGFATGGAVDINAPIAASEELRKWETDLKDILAAEEIQSYRNQGDTLTEAKSKYKEVHGFAPSRDALQFAKVDSEELAYMKDRAQVNMERLTDIVKTDPFDQYRRLAGEVEARNVQARRKLTPEQRKWMRPEMTADVPESEMIVTRDSALFQSQEDIKNLYVGHNLSQENLKHAMELGGLPAPSLAVNKAGNEFSSFGDITLLADPSLLESPKVKAFDADVYTPRHPRALHDIDKKAYDSFVSDMGDIKGLRVPGISDLSESSGKSILEGSPGVQYAWLKSQGKNPPTKNKKLNPMDAKAAKLLRDNNISSRPAAEDNESVSSKLDKMVDQKMADMELRIKSIAKKSEADKNDLRKSIKSGLISKALDFNENSVDESALKESVARKFRNKKLREDYKKYIDDKFGELVKRKRLFKGFTYSGTRRYVDYTMDNILKDMTKNLRGGEDFNYGPGNIRAAYAKQYKGIKDIAKDRDRIVSAEKMEIEKENARNITMETLEALKPYYKFDADGFNYYDDASSAIIEGQKGLRETFEDVPFVRQKVDQLTKYLKSLPTEYFEAKAQRKVDFSEFKIAVVPRGTDKELINRLKENGLKIAYYKEGDQQSRTEAIQKASEKNNLVFQQQRAAFNPATFTISLMEGSDLSSVIHEGGHFFLEAMHEMVSMPEAPQELKDDWQKIMEWFGLDPNVDWRSLILEEKRPYHEQWAESFERYAMEGKAPSNALKRAFAKFRDWMLSVYKSLRSFLESNPLAGKIDDDIRKVFDRMLASEEAIQEAENIHNYSSTLFDSAEAAGVSQSDYEEYLNLGRAASEDALSEMTARSLQDMKWASGAKDRAIRKLQREAADKRKEIKEEVTLEVMREPVNQARTFLAKGQITDEDGNVINAESTFKLDRSDVKALYPDANMNQLRNMTVAKDGVSADLAASLLGFDSGDSLVNALLNEEKAKDKIAGLTDQRMLERYGDLVDERAVNEAANEAIHNSVRERFIATGLKMLTKQPVSVREMTKAANEAAQRTISTRKVRDIKPTQFESAEKKAMKKALKLAAKDPMGASMEQRSALLNHALYKEATKAQKEADKFVDYLKKFDKKNTRKGLDEEYLEQIDDIKQSLDTRKGRSLASIDKSKSLADWIEDQVAMGFEPAIDQNLVEEAKRKHYKDLTMEELRGIKDTVRQIEHLGRMKKKLLTAGDKREFNARVEEANESIRKNANRTVEERGTPSDVIGVSAQWFRQMTAAHRKFNSIIREMDGGKDGGVMWELLSREMNRAGDNETEMRARAAERIGELFASIPHETTVGNLYTRKKLVPGTNFSMSQEQRIMFALNWGNEGNRQRLLDGGITGKKALSEPEAQAVLDTLTKAEWDFVQGVWDYIGSYKDEIAALEKKLTGVEPKWVDAAPIETKFGTYRGGYFPAKYDTELSTRSESLEAATTLRMGMKGAFGHAATRSGYAKERANQVVGRPLSLNYNVISQHVSEVTHRLAWQPWVTDAGRLLRALDAPIREHYGPEILRELRKTVEDIAEGTAPATSPIEKALNRLRTGSTIVGMGWRFTTALLQPAGLTQSWARIGGRWISRGVYDFMKSPLDSGKLVDEQSKLMRDRNRTMQREINEILNTIRSGEKVSALTASYFTMIAKMQRTVDIPTWLGAREKALYEMGYQNAVDETQRREIEQRAIDLADQAVIDSQSGGMVKDLARVQRGSPIYKLFTNFYSYFSAAYNLNVETIRRTNFRSPSEVGLMAVDLLMINVVPIVFSVVLRQLLRGGCDWNDMACLGREYADEQISHFMGQTILTREAAGLATALSGGQTYGYQGPAGLRFFADLQKAGVQAAQGEADMPLFKSVNSVGGALFHYPAGQINSTLEGIIAIERGEVEGAQILPALLAGPPKD